ncbi:RIP metalloprotease RseP [Lysobacter soyae]|uniref:Zinc metalloprotease n=1 Tax=Lysobacter soyae TaxID=2764185 RepID=A0ABX8WQF0_9GAMM|nr:RIP metalloprotease RseP [Lysobacter sp. CJ11]QYR52492.1 RIP metalloprotease RseP [Lysobacter sp. CJ11]
MSTFLGSILWLVVTLGVLVTLHELGHFWMARAFGIRVNRFSWGFGKPLWSRRAKDGVEYAIAGIPLGGYVSILEDPDNTLIEPMRSQALTHKPKWQRALVFAAGPLMNLFLCIVFLWVMLVVGRPDYTPVVGDVRGMAAEQGFKPGDTLLSIGGQSVPTWNDALMPILRHGVARDRVTTEVRTAEGATQTRTLDFSAVPADTSDTALFAASGLIPKHWLIAPVIGEVRPGTPAAGVLQSGDRILTLDDRPVRSFTQIAEAVRAAPAEHTFTISFVRDGETQTTHLKPALSGSERLIGIGPAATTEPGFDTVYRLGPLAAIPAALRETATLARDTASMVVRLFSAPSAREGVSGPITIARVANESAGQGFAWFLRFLALMSLSLAVINLMPVPFLDGGHLLYLAIETIRGRPLEPSAMMVGQLLGATLLVSLMGLAFYNDILGLLR